MILSIHTTHKGARAYFDQSNHLDNLPVWPKDAVTLKIFLSIPKGSPATVDDLEHTAKIIREYIKESECLNIDQES